MPQTKSAVVVDRAWVDQRDRLLPLSKPLDLVVTEQAAASGLRALGSDGDDTLVTVGARVAPDRANGEFIGMALFSGAAWTLWVATRSRPSPVAAVAVSVQPARSAALPAAEAVARSQGILSLLGNRLVPPIFITVIREAPDAKIVPSVSTPSPCARGAS